MIGPTVEGMRAHGRIIKWMAQEYLIGRINEGMLENTKMIKRKVKVTLHGLMEDNTKEDG